MAVQISGNDITVPRDGTFTRNVTIGGTLTYEDVTNIDSVGLVTARTGIEIGARPGVAASISVDGNAIFSGISTFSNTTESSASTNGSVQFDGGVGIVKNLNVGGDLSVTSTLAKISLTDSDSGDVYQLRNDAGSFIVRNATDSTSSLVITEDGKVGINQTPTRELSVHSPNNNNALIHFTNDDTGEASSDGILLGLDGNENMNINHQETGKDINLYMGGSQRLKIDSYGRVLIGGTSAIIGSSSEFSEIVLTGKTRGAGVTLQDEDAVVRFQIRTDDDVSSFQGTLLNASTNHGISIRTNNTEKIRLRANGLQTITYQYFLHAGRSGDQTGFNAGGDYGTPMTYNNIVTENKDSTLSSCFNTSNGLFTAPVPGTYLFIASAYTNTGNVLQQSWFTLNGSRAAGTDIVSNNTASYAFVHSQTIMRLAAGNTVGFKPYGSGQNNLTIDDNSNHTYFKVTLLS